ncbi:MAG: hypothetical protein ACI3W7_02410 [Oscillospiraceae bacterium]
MKKFLAMLMALCMVLSLGTVVMASGEPSAEAASAEAVSLVLTDPAWELSADGSYYSLKNVPYCTNVVNATYQYMNIYVPAAYLEGGEVNGYTADTAPIIIENNCMGWNSSTPGSANTGYLAEGFVHVNVGARSRNAENGTGKMPAPVVDQKAAVRTLRLNADVIPGDEEKIISLGTSGGGQMSSILGATGNMDEYYPYLYEIGAAGIDLVNGEYVSTINDNIFASMCFCPIADLNNADLAYAWLRFDAGEASAMTMFSGEIAFSEFQLALQNDLAVAFCEYINSLGIRNADGEVLSFDLKADGTPDPRSGSFYDQTLQNISDALNAWIDSGAYAEGGASSEPYESVDAYLATLKNPEAWLVKNADGSYSVTDLAGFLNGTGLARNKDIPGFDTFFATEEGNGFGTSEEGGVHFSASVAAVLVENYDRYSQLDGFADQDVDAYIEQAGRADIQEQAYLMNATQIMLAVANGTEESDIARHWRTRNGTADEHTSFSIAYDLAMSALMAGAEDVDYSLVWNMPHGDAEGTSTGTFIDWVHAICADEAPSGSAEPAAAAELSAGGWPLSGAGDTSMDAFKSYLKAYMDCVPEMDGHGEELYGLIDAEIWEAPVAMAWEDWFQENAMTYDEFVAANGTYALARFELTSPAA